MSSNDSDEQNMSLGSNTSDQEDGLNMSLGSDNRSISSDASESSDETLDERAMVKLEPDDPEYERYLYDQARIAMNKVNLGNAGDVEMGQIDAFLHGAFFGEYLGTTPAAGGYRPALIKPVWLYDKPEFENKFCSLVSIMSEKKFDDTKKGRHVTSDSVKDQFLEQINRKVKLKMVDIGLIKKKDAIEGLSQVNKLSMELCDLTGKIYSAMDSVSKGVVASVRGEQPKDIVATFVYDSTNNPDGLFAGLKGILRSLVSLPYYHSWNAIEEALDKFIDWFNENRHTFLEYCDKNNNELVELLSSDLNIINPPKRGAWPTFLLDTIEDLAKHQEYKRFIELKKALFESELNEKKDETVDQYKHRIKTLRESAESLLRLSNQRIKESKLPSVPEGMDSSYAKKLSGPELVKLGAKDGPLSLRKPPAVDENAPRQLRQIAANRREEAMRKPYDTGADEKKGGRKTRKGKKHKKKTRKKYKHRKKSSGNHKRRKTRRQYNKRKKKRRTKKR